MMRLGIGIGGTFSDFVAYDNTHAMRFSSGGYYVERYVECGQRPSGS